MKSFHRPFIAFSIASTFAFSAAAQDDQTAQDAGQEKVAVDNKALIEVTKTGDDTYQMGEIKFNSKTHEIWFPASVNMVEGLIEFPITHVNGRVHEAIFLTNVLPIQLQTVLALNRYETSQEAFPLPLEVEVPLGGELPPLKYPKKNPKSHVAVTVKWTDAEKKEHSAKLEDLLVFAREAEPNKAVPYSEISNYWVFTGTNEPLGESVPDLGGAYVGSRSDRACILNPEPKREILANTWFADAKKIPAIESSVTVHLSPVKEESE